MASAVTISVASLVATNKLYRMLNVYVLLILVSYFLHCLTNGELFSLPVKQFLSMYTDTL